MKPRTSFLLAVLGSALLGSCTTGQARDVSTPKAQKELAEALAGRVPGPPQHCIRNYRTNNMQVIDDYTILFEEGRTIYLQKPLNGCFGIGNHSRTLVTRPFGTTDLCEGDINKLVDLTAGIQGGACVFGPFVPYTKPKS
jgi:hypothetical protein